MRKLKSRLVQVSKLGRRKLRLEAKSVMPKPRFSSALHSCWEGTQKVPVSLPLLRCFHLPSTRVCARLEMSAVLLLTGDTSAFAEKHETQIYHEGVSIRWKAHVPLVLSRYFWIINIIWGRRLQNLSSRVRF